MDQELQDFITNYLELSKFRNVSAINPIRFEIQPDRANSNRTFIIVVSPIEPTFSKLPYNVLWVPSDTNHPAFGTCIKRTGHIASDIYNAGWETVLTYADLWLPDQYYQFVVEDPRLHGIDSEDSVAGPASFSGTGLVLLSQESDEGIVVEEADPRNSNARYPNFHTHPDYPRTKVKINETDYALVSTSAPPQQGMLLYIVGQSSDNANEYIAVWKFPTQSDITVIDRSLLAIRIDGVSSMPEQTQQAYTVTAVYADLTEVLITPDQFTINDTGVATLSLETGVLSVGNITNNRTLTLFAEFTEDGITVTDTHDISVTVGVEITSIQIIGPDTVNENTTQQYIVRAFFNDGSNADVVADTIGSSIVGHATINETALLSAQEVNGGDKNTVLNASYTFDEVVRTASKTVTIIDLTPLVNNLVVIGPSTVEENTTTLYTFKLVYSDGSEVVDIDPSGIMFSQPTGTGAVFNSADNYDLIANEVTQDRLVRINASYVEFGRTVTGFLDVTITNSPAVAVSAEIIGNPSIPEGDSATYVLRVTYNDSTTQDFNDPTWSIGSAFASVLSTGIVTGSLVSQDETVTLLATKTIGEVVFTDISLDILIINAQPIAVSLDITAPSGTTGTEGDIIALVYTVTYDDASTLNVKASPLLAETFVGNSRSSVFSGADANDVTLGQVVGNQSITVRGSYTEDGVTVTDTIALGILDGDVTPRWGIGIEQNLKADYGTPEFYDTLTNNLTGVNNETVALVFTEAATGSNNLGYLLYPEAWGYAFITNTDTNFSGGWDFASVTTSDATFSAGPVSVNIAGTIYYVYRTDFPLDPGTYNFKIEYGGSSPGSSMR
jgi:hypothetical protein